MPNTPLPEFDDKEIDAIFAELDQCQHPGAAVGIAIAGKPVYRKGFGLASMELPVVLSPSMRMRIFSATKQFTCFAYMLLCEEGRAGIDDPVGKHLPELHPVTHRVTMRQLMGHTGGLRDSQDISVQFSGTTQQLSSADLLALYCDIDDANFSPGTAFQYNNGGYVILGAVIERITGQSLEEVFRERIFAPLGMHDTLLRRLDTDFVPNSATLHTTRTVPEFDGTTLEIASPAGGFEKSYPNRGSAAQGGIVSTVDDMLRWLAHMDAPAVGTAATWKAMKTPQTLANGSSTDYGTGLRTGRNRGFKTIFHGGVGMGGNSQILKVPAAGLDVAIMVNRHDVFGTDLCEKILSACLPGSGPDNVKETSNRAAIGGIFRSPATGRIVQLVARNGHQIVSIDGLDIRCEYNNKGVLCPPRKIASHFKWTITLVGNPDKPTSIRFCDFGNLDDLVGVAPAENPNLSAIAGRYRSDPTGTEATISQTDKGPCLRTVGRFGSASYRVECLSHSIWRASSQAPLPFGGMLSFDRDGKTMRFTSPPTRLLPFRRCETLDRSPSE